MFRLGGEDADPGTEEQREAWEPIAHRTRAGALAQPNYTYVETVTSPAGCTKQYIRRTGHTAGILVVTRPCGVIVHMQELIQAEGTHEVLQCLYDLHDRGVCPTIFTIFTSEPSGLYFTTCIYDNACHLDRTMQANVHGLEGVQFAIDRCVFLCRSHFPSWYAPNSFHESNHKCTGNRLSSIEGMQGVNSEAAEQLFRWISRFRWQCGHMNEDTFQFFLDNVLENHNRFVHFSKKNWFHWPFFNAHRWVESGGSTESIVRTMPCCSVRVHDPDVTQHWGQVVFL